MADNSYRSILKGTSIFGGVQIFQILLALIRGKFVALLLGPAGMGVNALFSSAHQTLSQISCLGLNLAIVKESATVKDHPGNLRRFTGLARRLVTLTGIAGAVICFLLAVPLSRLSFGTEAYAWGFRVLSLAVFFSVAGNGMMSVLQGMHKVKQLSKASLVGGAVGLFAGIPLFYFFGTAGIPPAIVLMTLSTFIFYWKSVRDATGRSKEPFVWRDHSVAVRRLVCLGLILVAGDLIGTSCTYAVNLFVRYFGNLSDLGLFQGANGLTNQYAGVVFTAMMLDYFPRLSACSGDNGTMRRIVCRQIEVVALIATPLMTLLMLTSPLVIRLLLSSEFTVISPLMRWLSFGILIKALSYPLGWVTFAKDNKRIYFWMEAVGANLLTLLLNCLGYLLFGLAGLGYALVADCAVCLLVYIMVNRRLYDLRLDKNAVKSIFLSILSAATVFSCSFITGPSEFLGLCMMTALTIVITIFCLRRLLALFKKDD